MKKFSLLFLIIIFLFNVVHAQTTLSNRVEFSFKFYPDSKKINFNPNYFLFYSFKEGNVTAYLDLRDTGFRGGYLSISNILGILDFYLAKYYISVEGTKALFDSMLYNRLNLNGIQLTLKKPFRLVLSYIPSLIESDVDFNTGRLIMKLDTQELTSKFLGSNLYALYDFNMQMLVNTFVVGAEFKPTSFVTLFGEYGNNSRQWAIGGSLKPLHNFILTGFYRGDGGYNIEAQITDLIPKLSIYGAYYSAPDSPNYMYIRISLPPFNFGTIDGLYGLYTSIGTKDVWYLRLSSRWGKLSNTLRIYKNWNFGAGWFDTTIPFTVEDIVNVTF
ncbi:MAG: hypothetical protein NZ841_04660 [Dictyoglomus sp.]|nr:hypothetical protein [Dictyoglomus sp.]MDW8188568.1 hypothetical protein [Dictyoglomus sp.]